MNQHDMAPSLAGSLALGPHASYEPLCAAVTGTGPINDQGDIEPGPSGITQLYKRLGAEFRSLLRESLLHALEEQNRSEQFNESTFTLLTTLLASCEALSLGSLEARSRVDTLWQSLLARQRHTAAVRVLAVIADAKIPKGRDYWRAAYDQVGAAAASCVFHGIARTNVESAFRWLEETYQDVDLKGILASNLVQLVESSADDLYLSVIGPQRVVGSELGSWITKYLARYELTLDRYVSASLKERIEKQTGHSTMPASTPQAPPTYTTLTNMLNRELVQQDYDVVNDSDLGPREAFLTYSYIVATSPASQLLPERYRP